MDLRSPIVAVIFLAFDPLVVFLFIWLLLPEWVGDFNAGFFEQIYNYTYIVGYFIVAGCSITCGINLTSSRKTTLDTFLSLCLDSIISLNSTSMILVLWMNKVLRRINKLYLKIVFDLHTLWQLLTCSVSSSGRVTFSIALRPKNYSSSFPSLMVQQFPMQVAPVIGQLEHSTV